MAEPMQPSAAQLSLPPIPEEPLPEVSDGEILDDCDENKEVIKMNKMQFIAE
jgi:hypothetical protein